MVEQLQEAVSTANSTASSNSNNNTGFRGISSSNSNSASQQTLLRLPIHGAAAALLAVEDI